MVLTVIVRTIVIYITVLVVMRLMGKREVGQLSTFDLVVAIMIAEIAVFPMEDLTIPLYMGLIPMFILVGMEILIAYVVLHSRFLRGMVEGAPSVLISGGKIIEREMRKQRYNINDLLQQLRQQSVFNIADVEYAILEPSGKLSIMLKSAKRPVVPADLGLTPQAETIPKPLIIDGEVIEQNLESQGLSRQWLQDNLLPYNQQPQDILYASLDYEGKLYISAKEKEGGDS